MSFNSYTRQHSRTTRTATYPQFDKLETYADAILDLLETDGKVVAAGHYLSWIIAYESLMADDNHPDFEYLAPTLHAMHTQYAPLARHLDRIFGWNR